MSIVTVANQKGGVGKTTTTMNIGAALRKSGKSVLLIDSDPQANLTSYLGVAPEHTLDQVYLSKRAVDERTLDLYISKTASGVDLIAADQALSGVEYYLFSRADRELVLAQFLDGVRARYDYILIDTPPSLNLLTLNALCASDAVLIPVQPEFFSLEGIVKISQAIENVKTRWNQKLRILGILPTQVSQRRKLTGEVIATLKHEFRELVFDAAIRDNTAVTESSGHSKSVLDYDRSSHGAKDYTAAAEEFAARCENLAMHKKPNHIPEAVL